MGSGSSSNISKDISLNQNNKDNFNSFENNENNNNDFGVIRSSESFKEKYPLQYTISELNTHLKNFLKKEQIQDGFFDKLEEDDPTFMSLKEKEKKDLTNFFRSNQSNMVDDLYSKISNVLNEKINFNNIINNLFKKEKASEIYGEKIKKEIINIEKNEHEFEIKYLTVMIVGKSGVGKSTLINNLLKLQGNARAKIGTGDFVTRNIGCYTSDAFPLFRLVDTRGIELNHNFGADAVKQSATNFINQQIKNNKPNDFVQCIWYCITGNRFEQVEIDLLNSLRDAYDNNSIPIIIIYTQATDNNAINGMKNYIKEKNIDAKFLKILAERKELVNGQYLEPFGLDELINETLKKCRQAMKGEMRSVMTNNIASNITNKIKEENKYILKYVFESSVKKLIMTFYKVLDDENFIKFIISLLGKNIECFLEKTMNTKSYEFLKKQDFIVNQINSYINYYKEYTNRIITPYLNKCPIDFIDYQVLVQRDENREIKIKNKRCLNEFVQTSKKFLNDNYYYISQINFLYYFTKNLLPKLTEVFESCANKILDEKISDKEIQNLISNCFSKKFGEFEKRVSTFFDNNNFRINRNNGFNNDNIMNNNFGFNNNYNNNFNQFNQFNKNNYDEANSLPSYTEINQQNNYGNYPIIN